MTNQRGSALIAVLIILIVVTVLGVVATRQGISTVNIATYASAQELLLQSSDVVLDKIENTDLTAKENTTGPFAYLRLDGSQGKEYIFCYGPMDPTKKTRPMMRLMQDVVLRPDGGKEGNKNGYCDVTQDKSYSSERRVVVTQTGVVRPAEAAVADPFEYHEQGTDSQTVKKPEQMRFRAHVSSIAPPLSRTTDDQMNACLKLPNDDNTVASGGSARSVTDCLFEEGIPSNSQVQEFVLGGVVTGEEI
ncbi:MAG: hypothetical protein VXW65_09360 [Pseudomonadota bacterium]|nr:hypothetical protein [Pseudomonadota bacterium]